MPIDPKSIKWDAPDPAAVKWDEPDEAKALGASRKQTTANMVGGAIRGAGSIGATILAPIDATLDYMNGKGFGLESNRERRKAMDEGLTSLIGSDPSSGWYQGAKTGTEIAGTMGIGGAAANVLARIPGLAAAAPNAIQAVRTAGMSAGNATGKTAMALRTAGGAINGGLAAGAVNPEDAGAGAIIGGALPGVAKVAGMAGQKVGQVIAGPAQSADMQQAIKAARSNGYVIPPSQANPSLFNRTLEGFSGKLTTAQNASARNQEVTGRLAAEALGLPGDTKLTLGVLNNVRSTAGQAYDNIGGAGVITPGQGYTSALDSIAAPFLKASQGFPNAKASPVIDLVESLRSPSFDAASAVEKIKQLRTAADDGFRTGNTDIARASKAAAAALEDAIEGHLQGTGASQLLQEFRDARQLIAKTYSVQKALNTTTGAVDARKLAADLKKGKPMTGGLKDAAEFAARFPKAAQTVEGMGSLPQTSPLDWVPAGALSMATSNPLMMAGVAARPAARAAVLSPMVQNRLIQNGAPNALQAALAGSDLAQLGYRVAPNALNGR
jgi:hypothetical protein